MWYDPCYKCTELCEGCTLDQRAVLNLTLRVDQHKHSLVAVQGLFDTTKMQSNENFSIALHWIQTKRLGAYQYSWDSFNEPCGFSSFVFFPFFQESKSGLLNSYKAAKQEPQLFAKLLRTQGKNLHVFRFFNKNNMFVFVKYADKTHSTTSEFGNYLIFEYSSVFYESDNYPHHHCPDISHYPEVFSWKQAAQFCHKLNATLPKLICKKDQDYFVAFFEQKDPLFTVEAVFIALIKPAQVRQQSNFCNGIFSCLIFQCYLQAMHFLLYLTLRGPILCGVTLQYHIKDGLTQNQFTELLNLSRSMSDIFTMAQ